MDRIAVIGPCTPYHEDKKYIIESLNFLMNNFRIDYFDPLIDDITILDQEKFISAWRGKILNAACNYKFFIGFSLGGILIKSCFGYLEMKPSIIFSAPTTVDFQLRGSLSEIINLLARDRYVEALRIFNELVYYPGVPNKLLNEIRFKNEVKNRLVNGLNYVLNINQLPFYRGYPKLLQFVGELSKLVNISHISDAERLCTQIVPNSGMRMLENNPDFCQPLVLKFLEEHSKCRL